jgi:hypothetical protein
MPCEDLDDSGYAGSRFASVRTPMSNLSPESAPLPDPDQPPSPQCPRELAIAAALWLALGIVLAVGSLWYGLGTSSPSPYEVRPSSLAVLLVIGLGVVFIVGSRRLRRGGGRARIVLTILGGLFLFALWPALLVVPALVLQYRPASNAWFQQLGGAHLRG